MTDQPAVGPLSAGDVKLLKGDWLRCEFGEDRFGVSHSVFQYSHTTIGDVVHGLDGRTCVNLSRCAFIGRPDSEGWISGRPPKEITDLEVSLQGTGTHDSGDMKWRPIRLAATPQVETPGPAAAFAPGHTDLMVSPESIDAFLEANPLPDNTGGEVEASGAVFTPDHKQRAFDLARPQPPALSVDLAELKRLALAVPVKDWVASYDAFADSAEWGLRSAEDGLLIADLSVSDFTLEADAATASFLQAANPSVVLALIAQIERGEG